MSESTLDEKQFLKELYTLSVKYDTLPKYDYLDVFYEGDHPTPEIEFVNYMEQNGVILPIGALRSMHPSIVFIAIAVRSEILRINSNIISKLKGNCDIVRVKLGKYESPKGTGLIEIPIGLSSEEFNTHMEKYDVTKCITRPPQLRRLLKKYCDYKDIYFNEDKLKETLTGLNLLHHDVYCYYDSDEEILFNSYKDTYLDILPRELKFIICGYIDDYIENIKIEKNVLSEVISSLVSTQITSGNSLDGENIMKIYEKLHQQGYSQKIKEESQGKGILQYLEKMGGAPNLLGSLVSIIVDDLSKIDDNS